MSHNLTAVHIWQWCCKNIVLNGSIISHGGKGGNADGGNSAGGGGGGGGLVILVYDNKTGAGTVTATAGAKGDKWGAGDGNDGAAGAAGTVIQIQN